MASQSTTNEASKLELKLGSMIEELKSNTNLDIFEVQEHNKQIRLSMNQLRSKIKVCVCCVCVCFIDLYSC